MIKVIIFDFDGVLFDSVSVKTKAFYEMFKPYGENIGRMVTEHHLANGGVSRFEKLRIYYGDFLKQQVTEDFILEKAAEFSGLVVDKVVESPWIPGAYEFLCQNCDKYFFFIVSGTPEDELLGIVDRKEITRFFKGIYGSPKNKKENIQRIIELHKFNTDQMVFIGDAGTDYEAAKGSGLSFVGVGDYFRDFENVISIKDLTSLEFVLKQLRPIR